MTKQTDGGGGSFPTLSFNQPISKGLGLLGLFEFKRQSPAAPNPLPVLPLPALKGVGQPVCGVAI